MSTHPPLEVTLEARRYITISIPSGRYRTIMIEGLLVAAVPVVLGAALKDGIPCASSSTSGGLGDDQPTGKYHEGTGRRIFRGKKGGEYYLTEQGQRRYV